MLRKGFLLKKKIQKQISNCLNFPIQFPYLIPIFASKLVSPISPLLSSRISQNDRCILPLYREWVRCLFIGLNIRQNNRAPTVRTFPRPNGRSDHRGDGPQMNCHRILLKGPRYLARYAPPARPSRNATRPERTGNCQSANTAAMFSRPSLSLGPNADRPVLFSSAELDTEFVIRNAPFNTLLSFLLLAHLTRRRGSLGRTSDRGSFILRSKTQYLRRIFHPKK